MDIVDRRRENLKRWIALHGTPQKEKSLFSQLKGTGSFGEKVARRLEVEYQMGDLYLDQEPEPETSDSSLPYMHNVSRVAVGSSARETVPIKMVSMRLQAGIMGFEVQQNFEDGGTLDVPLEWIEENDYVPHCLYAIKVRGESMQPLMYDGDIAVVNVADTKRVSGGVYAINFDGEAVIKRLKYEGREWYMTSENRAPGFERRMCRGGDCIIVGRVVRFEPRNFKDRL